MTDYERFPSLVDLGGYFNEDWQRDASTWEELIDFYVEHSTPGRVAAVVVELTDVLAAYDDEQLASVLDELGFAYLADPQSDREWLVEVRDRLASPAIDLAERCDL
jgi:hypothetical protein